MVHLPLYSFPHEKEKKYVVKIPIHVLQNTKTKIDAIFVILIN